MNPEISRLHRARPVLKWAGGKRQLLSRLIARLPPHFSVYHEPFVGGAALFVELARCNLLATAYLSDINPVLIELYTALRDQVEAVITALKLHVHDEAYYYSIRALDPHSLTLPERAARIIYLNKTCFNGLYRENKAGKFNVPFGRHKNPTICDEVNLRAVSQLLQGVTITRQSFTEVLANANSGDFVYFDPPYLPTSATANFTGYARDGFGLFDQEQLRDVFFQLAERGIYAMLSNSDMPLIRDMYADANIQQVFATRAINSRGSQRGPVPELIICNYDTSGTFLPV